tara:strand:- start:9756 stop:10094 length:339 start_codon:yes stop_codon:yes gene_type:complete
MGYYSKVYIAVPEKDKVLMEVLARDFSTKDFNIGKKKFVFFYSDELKWYDMFSDVKPVNEFVQADPFDEEKMEGRAMIAIGEDGFIHNEVGDWPCIFKLETRVVDADINPNL